MDFTSHFALLCILKSFSKTQFSHIGTFAQISALLLWLSHCGFVNTCRRVYIHKQQQGCHLCADRSLGLNCSVT